MTDVRLTALNPEDSKVYPVACNSSGELLTTKSDDVNLDVAGNLDVGGSASVAGEVLAGTRVRFNVDGAREDAQSVIDIYDKEGQGVNASTVRINSDGSAEFASTIFTSQNFAAAGNASIEGNIVAGYGDASSGCKLSSNGTASFAGVKAGFTELGELIFTSRNERYKLVVSDGFLFPEPYTVQMELKERLEKRDGE